MQRKSASSAVIEPRLTDRRIAIEVRDLTVLEDVILGQVAVQSPTHMKPTDAKQLPTVRRIIAKRAVWTQFSLLLVEAMIVNVSVSVSASGIETVSVIEIWTGLIVVAETTPSAIMTVSAEIEKTSGRSFTAEGEILAEVQMNCPTETTHGCLMAADAGELTVILRVKVAREIPRFVASLSSNISQ